MSYITRVSQPSLCIGYDISAHTPEFAAAAGSRYARIQALVGAKAMARVAIDVLHEKPVRENPADEREAAWRQAFGG